MENIINLSTVIDYEGEYCLESCNHYEEAKCIRKCRLFNEETTFFDGHQYHAKRCMNCIVLATDTITHSLIVRKV